MSKSHRVPLGVLAVFVLLPWALLISSPGIAALRAVDTCLIMASGMALGGLIAAVAQRLGAGRG